MAGWTDSNQHDPGVTLLELLGWVAGALGFALGVYAYLRYRGSRVDDRPRSSARRRRTG